MSNTFDADVRYGSSFLDVGKHKKSVPGEILSDKITGEVYIKRPSDNKIISFRQKSQSVYEAIQEFNIQFQSSIGFTYPEDPGSFLLGTKIDVDEYLPNEDKKDILLDNHVFNGSVGTHTDIRFEVSNKTNGFYIKPLTRLGDKNICGYLSGQFREHESIDFTTVQRTFTEWLDLSPLYASAYLYTEWKENELWSSTNAIVDCTIRVVGMDEHNGTIENLITVTTPIQLNEYSFVRFPEEYKEEMVDIYSIIVTIDKVYAPKLEYERYLATDNNATSGINGIVDRLLEVDNKVALQSIDVFYFISGSSQLPTNENTSFNQCIDVEFLNQAMVYLSTSTGVKAIQSQVEKPDAWPNETIWAEEIRDIEYGHNVKETTSVNKFEDLERALYHDTEDTVVFTDELTNAENILIKTI